VRGMEISWCSEFLVELVVLVALRLCSHHIGPFVEPYLVVVVRRLKSKLPKERLHVPKFQNGIPDHSECRGVRGLFEHVEASVPRFFSATEKRMTATEQPKNNVEFFRLFSASDIERVSGCLLGIPGTMWGRQLSGSGVEF
jgi:hypothetical protein